MGSDVHALKSADLVDKITTYTMFDGVEQSDLNQGVYERFCRTGIYIRSGGRVAGSARYEILSDRFCALYANGARQCRKLYTNGRGEFFTEVVEGGDVGRVVKVILRKTPSNQSC